jgi:hypothetical protein
MDESDESIMVSILTVSLGDNDDDDDDDMVMFHTYFCSNNISAIKISMVTIMIKCEVH